MSGLYPTPTRLWLLRQVDDGEVWQGAGEVSTVPAHPDSDADYRNVTGRIGEMERAGWVRLHKHTTGARQWKLTAAGRAILDQHPEVTP